MNRANQADPNPLVVFGQVNMTDANKTQIKFQRTKSQEKNIRDQIQNQKKIKNQKHILTLKNIFNFINYQLI